MKTSLSAEQRQQLRDFISAVGVGKNPTLLEILEETEDDFELIKIGIVASAFDGQTPRQTTEFLKERGVCAEDIIRALRAILATVQGPEFVHGWN
jgi:hypothetical protein